MLQTRYDAPAFDFHSLHFIAVKLSITRLGGQTFCFHYYLARDQEELKRMASHADIVHRMTGRYLKLETLARVVHAWLDTKQWGTVDLSLDIIKFGPMMHTWNEALHLHRKWMDALSD